MRKRLLLCFWFGVGVQWGPGRPEENWVAMISPALTSTFYIATNAGATEVAKSWVESINLLPTGKPTSRRRSVWPKI